MPRLAAPQRCPPTRPRAAQGTALRSALPRGPVTRRRRRGRALLEAIAALANQRRRAAPPRVSWPIGVAERERRAQGRTAEGAAGGRRSDPCAASQGNFKAGSGRPGRAAGDSQ